MEFVKKSVVAIRQCKLIPIALVMDQCTTNQKMIREAGATCADPIISIDGKEIAVLYDTPHMLKNTRNAIHKHNAVFEGQIASFKHVKQLYDEDVSSILRLAPKLSLKCIVLPPFTKMNVPLATRTLSESTSIAMQHYVHTGQLDKGALATASFIAFHDKLFDIFNSKERYADSIGKVSILVQFFEISYEFKTWYSLAV